MSKNTGNAAQLTHRYGLRLVTLMALVAGACNAGDSVSPPRAPEALTQWNPRSDVDAIRGRIDATFAGVPKRKSPRNGRLAFNGFNGAIHTMEPDGFGLTRIGDGYDPSWSPDGNRIAFWRSSGSYGSDVYVMDADGGNVTLVTRNGYQPTWSPDGKQLAFGCGGICVINVDGTGRRIVTTHDIQPAVPALCVRDSDPTWSPNGTTIAFTRWPDSRIPETMCLPFMAAFSFPFDFWTEVWFVESDGTDQRPLRAADGTALTYAGWPSWSPDGSQLALYYVRVHEAIMVANADGSNLREVVRRSPANFFEYLGGPDWSPDGKQIVLGSGNAWGLVPASATVSNPAFRAPFQFLSYGNWSWSRR